MRQRPGQPGIVQAPHLCPCCAESVQDSEQVFAALAGKPVELPYQQHVVAPGQRVRKRSFQWRAVSDWKQAFLGELQGRAALNKAIRRLAEKAFNLPVIQLTQTNEPRLTPQFVSLVRRAVTRAALGEPDLGAISDVEWQGQNLSYTRSAFTLVVRAEDKVKAAAALTAVLKSAGGLAEAAAAAGTYRELEGRTRRVWDHCRSYMLLHHIPGRCSLCKKLGGR